DRATTTCELPLKFLWIKGRLFHFYFCPVGIKLLRHDHWKRSHDILTQFRVGGVYSDGTVCGDGQIAIKIQRTRKLARVDDRRSSCFRTEPAKAQQQTATCH